LARKKKAISSIILAAGKSSRMRAPGKAKVCYPVAGKPAIVWILEALRQAGVPQHVVVVGSYAEQVMRTVAEGFGEVTYAFQPQALGTGNAAKHGAALLRRLIGVWRAGARMAPPAVDGQLRGAPGLFDRSLWPELMAVRGDTGGRPLLRRYRDQVKTVPTGAETLTDIDTLTDFRELTYPTSDDSMGAQT
jgi:CTP:molybdopterin cytidylyltransferase MocA